MPKTFFFYDLETSGLNGRDDRIMQFAGIRTDEQFNQIGEPHNLMVALADDTLPSPRALMVTGISPQQTVDEGYTEAQFARIFVDEIATPDTTIVGYNNVRFDDEFIRALLWRNYHDPYEWSYKDGRSRWDILDVVRMTRALRPDGIEWPVVDGKPVNKLELLARVNHLEHTKAHDALSDVEALIGVTKLIAEKQTQLFQYLLTMRDKSAVKKLVNLDDAQPVVYTSGRYDAAYEKTTVVVPIAAAEHGNVYVYDLRHDPSEWCDKTAEELQAIISKPYAQRDEDYRSLPVKKLQYNHCPAVAPLGVLEQQDGWSKLGLELGTVESNRTKLLAQTDFIDRVAAILSAKSDYTSAPEAESKLYDSFVGGRDKLRSEAVRNANADELRALDPKFDDARLIELYPRYKARNFPRTMTNDDRDKYEAYRAARIARQAPGFMRDLQAIAGTDDLSAQQQFIIDEMKLWYESIVPIDEETTDELDG